MSFELILDDAKLMSNISSIISSIVAESNLSVFEKGIQIKAFDAARIALIDFFMKKEAFVKYEVKEPSSVGLSLEVLNTILKTAKSDEKLRLSLDKNTNRFIIEFLGKNQKRRFAVDIIEIPEETKLPDSVNLKFDAEFQLKASFIQQVIRDAEMISDHLVIKAKNDKVIFETSSESKEMSTSIEPQSEDFDTETFQVNGEPSAIYALDYLANFLKGIKSSEMVQISFSTAQPMRIIYNLDDQGHLIYFVAPRAEEESYAEEDYEDIEYEE